MVDLDTCLYVLATLKGDGEHCAPVKVGITSNPKSRIHSIATSCPFPVQLYFGLRVPRDVARMVEGSVHKTMAKHQTHREWFGVHPWFASGMICSAVANGFVKIDYTTEDIMDIFDGTLWCIDKDFEPNFREFLDSGLLS